MTAARTIASGLRHRDDGLAGSGPGRLGSTGGRFCTILSVAASGGLELLGRGLPRLIAGPDLFRRRLGPSWSGQPPGGRVGRRHRAATSHISPAGLTGALRRCRHPRILPHHPRGQPGGAPVGSLLIPGSPASSGATASGCCCWSAGFAVAAAAIDNPAMSTQITA